MVCFIEINVLQWWLFTGILQAVTRSKEPGPVDVHSWFQGHDAHTAWDWGILCGSSKSPGVTQNQSRFVGCHVTSSCHLVAYVGHAALREAPTLIQHLHPCGLCCDTFVGRWIIWAKSRTRGYPTHLSMTSLSFLILPSDTGGVTLGSVCSYRNRVPCVPSKLSLHTAQGWRGHPSQGDKECVPTSGRRKRMKGGCSSAPQHGGGCFKLKNGSREISAPACCTEHLS